MIRVQVNRLAIVLDGSNNLALVKVSPASIVIEVGSIRFQFYRLVIILDSLGKIISFSVSITAIVIGIGIIWS